MSKQKTIWDRFDENFGFNPDLLFPGTDGNIALEQIKTFFRQEIIKLLKGLEMEEWEIPKEKPKRGRPKKYSMSITKVYPGRIGFNQASSKTNTKIKSLIKEIKK